MKFSILTVVLIGLFWFVYFLVYGSVPADKEIGGFGLSLSLPFGIKRWWDALMGPIWSILITWLVTSKRFENSLFYTFVRASVMVGLFLSFFYGLFNGISDGIVGILLFSILAALIMVVFYFIFLAVPFVFDKGREIISRSSPLRRFWNFMIDKPNEQEQAFVDKSKSL